MKNVPQWLIIHQTGGTDANPKADTSNQTFEVVNEYHRKLWNYKSSLGHFIGYHYFIDKTGKVTQGRADSDVGAHTKGLNSQSIGCCLAGNFDATMPTVAQTRALKALLERLSSLYAIPPERIVPHRRFANKTCYGTNLSDTWAAELVAKEVEKSCSLERFTTNELFAEIRRRIAGMGT